MLVWKHILENVGEMNAYSKPFGNSKYEYIQTYAQGLLSLVMIWYRSMLSISVRVVSLQSYDYPGASEAALNPLRTRNYSDVIMGTMASQITSVDHLRSLFTQPFIEAQIKENTKAPRHWPLWGEFTGDRWIPHTKGQ